MLVASWWPVGGWLVTSFNRSTLHLQSVPLPRTQGVLGPDGRIFGVPYGAAQAAGWLGLMAVGDHNLQLMNIPTGIVDGLLLPIFHRLGIIIIQELSNQSWDVLDLEPSDWLQHPQAPHRPDRFIFCHPVWVCFEPFATCVITWLQLEM